MSVTTVFFNVVSKVSRTIAKMDIYKMSVFLDVFGLLRLHKYIHILSNDTRYYMLGFFCYLPFMRLLDCLYSFIPSFQTKYFRPITDFSNEIFSADGRLFKRNIFGGSLTFRPSAVLSKPPNFI